MKKIINILLLILFISPFISCTNNKRKEPPIIAKIINKEGVSIFGYGNTKWRMTRDEIVKLEKKQLIQSTSYNLIYQDMLFGENANLVYIFDSSDKLVYISHNIKSTPEAIQKIFNKLIKDFSKKYDKFSLSKDKASHVWKTKEYNIFLGLTSKKDSINVIYTYLNHNEWKLFLVNLFMNTK